MSEPMSMSPRTYARIYGNPYFSAMRPTKSTTLFNEWCQAGAKRGNANYPCFVDAKSGSIVITERDNHRVQFFDNVGRTNNFPLYGKQGREANEFWHPMGLTTTNELYARIIVCDSGNQRVGLFRVVGGGGDGEGEVAIKPHVYFGQYVFNEPIGVEYDIERKHVVVADVGFRRVTTHDLRTGACVGEWLAPPQCPFKRPTDIARDENGLWYVSDGDAHCIHVFDKNGKFIGRFGGQCGAKDTDLNHPYGLCFDRENTLLIADQGNNRVLAYRGYGKGDPVSSFSSVLTREVWRPHGVATNAHDNLVVVDSDPNNFVKIFKYK